MPRILCLSALLLLPFLASEPPSERKTEPQKLFDGKTFDGWDGDTKSIWRIEDGCFVGGFLDKKIKQNEFLATKASYRDFVLRLKFKLLGDTKKGFVNSGVQIRSQRDPKSSEMIGYQCDLGDPSWWGCVYDESRRNRVLAQSDMKAIEPVLKRGEWNDYEIRAEGRRIRTYINGALAVDYTEEDADIPQEGRLGLQIHGGGPAEAWFKDIVIEELPPVKDAADLAPRAPQPPPPPHASPLTPAEALKTFSVPPGFEVELVASEPDAGKPITVAWDHAGRLWTMTALEYPLDANENAAQSKALFEKGGKDRVLVFDRPYGPGPHRPRVFAEGLAIPLGMMPYRDGCFVQYGNQILRLRDTDGDGKADQREVFLDGFGTEDSHLFPHQFTRGPGGWLYFAQGAFNHSKVKAKEGPAVRMSYCKMARVRLDGSGFELVEAGLNNIWGFVIDRFGQMFIQEANDLGYPVVPFEVGANFPGIGMEKLKPYAPWTPPVPHRFQMGGTGLSGLALMQNEAFADAGYPREGRVFFVANPITRKVQAVWLEPTPAGGRLRLLPDFLLSSDPWFRPVSIHFGPDECLYVVDWCNAIISHNEVPRNHPERDKTRGRIWRIRAKSQERRTPTNVAKASDADLLALLGSTNAWEQTAAWQQIVDRGAKGLAGELASRARDGARPADERIRCLWALEGIGEAKIDLIEALLKAPHADVRREAARVLSGSGFAPGDVVKLMAPLTDDSDGGVRAAAIRTLGALKEPGPDAVRLLIRFGKAELPGKQVALEQSGTAKLGDAHQRDFERYLVRAALERQEKPLAAILISNAGEDLPSENLALAALALDRPEGARFLGKQLLELKRPPNPEELLRLVQHADDPGVKTLVPPLFARPETLKQLLDQRARVNAAAIKPLLLPALRNLWADEKQAELVYRAAAAFQLKELETEFLAAGGAPGARRLFAVKALRELGADCPDLFARLCDEPGAPSLLKEEAVLGLANCPNGAAPLLRLAPELNARQRRLALDRLAGSPGGAKAVVAAFASGALGEACLEPALVEKLQAVLKDDPALADFLRTQERFLRPVLRLDGRDDGFVADEIVLEGPFTVETWIKLDPGITNADSILGRTGVADFNFHDARLRLWAGPEGDLIIAKKQVFPEAWTHVAVTRDQTGRLRIFLNGELDTAEGRPSQATWRGLQVGHSNPPQGTKAAFAEFRVWNVARSAEQIRETFDLSLAGRSPPPGLVRRFADADWGRLNGSARLVRTTDFPPLLAPDEAQAQAEKFSKFRGLVRQPGDPAKGRILFEKNCMTCHTARGQGGQIGPTLNGAGLLSDEALLRNLLTPSVAMEPGYRLFRVELKNGTLKDGFLVRQNDEEIVLRRPGEEDQRIDARTAVQAGFSKRSVMPDGILEGLKPEEVRDLFAHLRTLK